MWMLIVIAVTTAIGVTPVPADAAWKARTVSTKGEAHLLALDALPDGRFAMLLQAGPLGRRSLELHIDNSVETLAESCCPFGPVKIDHDDSGRPTVAWESVLAGGSEKGVFVWTPDEGTRQLPGANTLSSLDVAADGGAVLVMGQGESIVVSRRPPRGVFGGPVQLAETSGDRVPVGAVGGVASGGRVVVAWTDCLCGIGGHLDTYVMVAAAGPASGFGPAQRVAISSDLAIEGPFGIRIAVTPSGRGVVASQVIRQRRTRSGDQMQLSSSIVAFDWAPSHAAPSPARIVSRAQFSGPPALIARGESVVLAWKESNEISTARRLRTVFWNPGGPDHPTAYRPPRDLGTLKFGGQGVSLAPFGDAGARAFYQTRGGRWYAIAVMSSGRYRRAASVSLRGERAGWLLADAGPRGTVAAWTARFGRTRPRFRVRVARP